MCDYLWIFLGHDYTKPKIVSKPDEANLPSNLNLKNLTIRLSFSISKFEKLL